MIRGGSREEALPANRAVQFAPFTALTGCDAAIDETARLTEEKVSLSDHETAELNRKLQDLSQMLPNRPDELKEFFEQLTGKTIEWYFGWKISLC